MIAFLEKTWLLWWMFAVVVIVRWFHVLSADPGWDALDSPHDDQGESHVVSGQIAYRA
jgi:hypothetical protein